METKREILSSGSNVDEAVAAGLATLGVDRDAVQIEVLDTGSRGLLGIGARPARVRMMTLAETALLEQPQPSPPISLELEPTPTVAADAVSPDIPSAAPTTMEDELKGVAPVARQTLEELLSTMGIQAQVEDYVKLPEDADDYEKLILNVRGRDLGVLIGRRGETLEALQYLTRLIVGREVERRINLVVDVEGYRVRRERSLRQLAERMAERAIATGQRQVLEPMSAAERRIVHVALRSHSEVATESIGEDDNRKVTIFLRGSN